MRSNIGLISFHAFGLCILCKRGCGSDQFDFEGNRIELSINENHRNETISKSNYKIESKSANQNLTNRFRFGLIRFFILKKSYKDKI